MAIPAIVGLGALAGVISQLFSKFIEFLFTKTAKRILIITVVVAGIYAALQVLFLLFTTYATPLLASIPPELSFIGSFLPSNTTACLAAIISVEIGCIVYSLTLKALELQTEIIK
jgi:hypothetical protein